MTGDGHVRVDVAAHDDVADDGPVRGSRNVGAVGEESLPVIEDPIGLGDQLLQLSGDIGVPCQELGEGRGQRPSASGIVRHVFDACRQTGVARAGRQAVFEDPVRPPMTPTNGSPARSQSTSATCSPYRRR
jgi:hypothetical protein